MTSQREDEILVILTTFLAPGNTLEGDVSDLTA